MRACCDNKLISIGPGNCPIFDLVQSSNIVCVHGARIWASCSSSTRSLYECRTAYCARGAIPERRKIDNADTNQKGNRRAHSSTHWRRLLCVSVLVEGASLKQRA